MNDRNPNQARAHYMKLGARLAYCGRTSANVKVAYDDWAKVTCTDCLAHPGAPEHLRMNVPTEEEA